MELMAQNEMKGLMFKLENDPRITKVGKFIRKQALMSFHSLECAERGYEPDWNKAANSG